MNLDELKALFGLLEEQGIAEFELEEENLKLRIRRSAAPAAHAPAPATTAHAAASPASSTQALPSSLPGPMTAESGSGTTEEEAGLIVVKSPIVGTFYRAPDPTSPPFVNVGDKVRVGQVLCIIEAMKLMNEIEAEVEGELVKIHHENGQPVQFGEPLFTVRSDR